MQLIEGGFAAAEAEFELRIVAVPEGPAMTPADAASAIGSIRVGVEVAGSPYAEINAHGPAVTVSDFGNNLGLVLGPEIHVDAGNAFEWTVSSFVNHEEVGSGVAATPAGGPFEAAHFLFQLAARHGLPVEPGQWISTGAITGGHQVAPADQFEARFGEGATVRCRF